MTLELLENLIENDFGYSYVGNWGKAHKHNSLVVDRQKALWFWNSMDLRGNVKDYLTKVRNLSDEQARAFIRNNVKSQALAFVEINQDDVVPYERLVEYLWLNGKGNREYWYKRHLNDNTIDRFKLGFSDEWYTIPLYVNGNFKNFQCRKDLPEKKIRPWYKGIGPLLFNSDILPFVDKVYITEGPVDAILLTQFGYPAVSHTSGASGWNNDWFKFFPNQKEIIYIADNDKAGIEGAIKVAKCLGETRVKTLRFHDLPEKSDFIDFVRGGGTKEEFESRLKSDLKYIFEGV